MRKNIGLVLLQLLVAIAPQGLRALQSKRRFPPAPRESLQDLLQLGVRRSFGQLRTPQGALMAFLYITGHGGLRLHPCLTETNEGGLGFQPRVLQSAIKFLAALAQLYRGPTIGSSFSRRSSDDRVLGRRRVSIPLAKTGDSDRRQILSEYTLVARNEKSSAGVLDLSTS